MARCSTYGQYGHRFVSGLQPGVQLVVVGVIPIDDAAILELDPGSNAVLPTCIGEPVRRALCG